MLKDGLAIKLQLCNVHRGNNWNTVGAGSSRSWCDQITVSSFVATLLWNRFKFFICKQNDSNWEQCLRAKVFLPLLSAQRFHGFKCDDRADRAQRRQVNEMSWIKPGLIDGHEAAGWSETERGDDHVTEHELSLSRSLALKWLCFYI